MPNLSTLIDPLTTTVLNTANWGTPTTATNTSITPTVNGLVFANAVGTTTAQSSSELSTSGAFTFDAVYFELTNVTVAANSGFYAVVTNNAFSVKLGIQIDSGNIYATVNGAQVGSAVTFNPQNHRWISIVAASTSVSWYTSQDGINYTLFYTYSTSNPLSGASCYLQFGTYVDATLTAAASYTVSFVNVAPIGIPQINDWLAGNTVNAANGTIYGDLDVYVSQAMNFLAQPPYLRAIQSVVQSLAAGATTAVTMDKVLDQQGCQFTPGSAFTATYSGWYGINLVINSDPTAGCQIVALLGFSILGSGVGPIVVDEAWCEADPWLLNAYGEYYLNAGDTVTPYFYNTSATAFNSQVSGAPYQDCSALEIVWLGT